MAEMTALEFLKEKKRMCKSYGLFCAGCGIYREKGGRFCEEFTRDFPEKAIAIVEKWLEEHPRKTILQDFLEKYPKAVLDEYGIPFNICPYYLGYEKSPEDDNELCNSTEPDSCAKCWNRPLEEVENNG